MTSKALTRRSFLRATGLSTAALAAARVQTAFAGRGGKFGQEEEDPAEALIRQLKAYKRFKQAAVWLHEREEAGLRTYLRVAPPPKLEGALDLSGVTVQTLMTAVQEALARGETKTDSVSLARPRRVTIEGQIKLLRTRLKQYGRSRFNDLLPDKAERVEVAITLLAVLELIKRRELTAVQPELFGRF